MAMHVLNVINSKISIHVKSKNMLLTSFILAGVTTLFVLWHVQIAGSPRDQFVLLSIMLLCSSAAYYGLFPIDAYFQRRISHRMRSTIISYQTSFSMLVHGLSLPFFGFLYSTHASATLLFLVVAFTVTLLLLLWNTKGLLKQ